MIEHRITERGLRANEKAVLKQCAETGAKLLKLTGNERPAAVVKLAQAYVRAWHKGGFFSTLLKRRPDADFAAIVMGTVWGNQVVRKFGWEWTCLRRVDAGREDYAVVTKDRSLAIFPIEFVTSCLNDPRVDCTASLSFKVLEAGKLPKLPERGYEDLMSAVRRATAPVTTTIT